jgi:hypothetical protein
LFSKRYKNLDIVLFSFLLISVIGIIESSFFITPNAFAQGTFPNFNFAAVGDWDCGSNAIATRNNIINNNPELVVGLGDYSYESNADCWLDIIDPIDGSNPGLDGKMEIAIGNHEIDESSQSLGQYLSHFNMPTQYHSFNHQNVHFLVLATDDTFGLNSNQYRFAVSDLQTASSNSNIDWIVVAFHKPFYDVPCSGDSCQDEDAVQGSTYPRTLYHPLFDQYGVDLALYGHAHNYVRTFPIKYDSSTPDSPTITSTNRNNYINPDGEVFVQSGAGGRSLRDLTGTENYNAFQSDSEFGILNVDVVNTDSNNLQLIGKFIQNDGDVIDQFTITKQVTNPPPTEVNCNNNIDDDRDGKIDAEDLDCPSVPEICDNGLDDDRDGFKDSQDSDCQSSGTGYTYEPFLTVSSHNDVVSIPSTQSLKLTQFSVSAWFKTTSNFGSEASIVNKGGFGTDSSGNNMNYGIWMTSSERVQGGFETSGGSNRYATSPSSLNDGQWHHGVVTYDKSIVRLYIDGTQVGTSSTTSNPETSGNHPLKIGANSRTVSNLFTGSIDEVGVWNRALNNIEIANLVNKGEFSTNGLVYRNSFDSSTPPPTEVNCNNNIDDDRDGKIDAEDLDCPSVPEICDNGLDDDRDGLIDLGDTNDCSAPPPPSSNILIPISVVASSQDLGKEAPKAVDSDFATRWSADGNGEWIDFTFDKTYPITKVGLTGYHYDKTYYFEINGKQFENPANRPTNTLIEYDLSDLNIQSDKVRIIGHGNSGSSYNSYREIHFSTQ